MCIYFVKFCMTCSLKHVQYSYKKHSAILIIFFCFLNRYLISQGAHVGAVNSEGDTPLDIAEEEAMEELLQNEVNRQGILVQLKNFHA